MTYSIYKATYLNARHILAHRRPAKHSETTPCSCSLSVSFLLKTSFLVPKGLPIVASSETSGRQTASTLAPHISGRGEDLLPKLKAGKCSFWVCPVYQASVPWMVRKESCYSHRCLRPGLEGCSIEQARPGPYTPFTQVIPRSTSPFICHLDPQLLK